MTAKPKETGRGPEGIAQLARRQKQLARRRMMLLLALLPVLVLAWLPVIRKKGVPPPVEPVQIAVRPVESPSQQPPPAPIAEVADTSSVAGVLAHSAELVGRLEHLVAPFEPRWKGADPFAQAVEAAAPSPRDVGGPGKVDAPDVELDELVPTAIVLSPTQGPIAILDGKVCRPGDIVAGRVVVAIEERRVVLRAGDQTYAVSMPLPELGGSR